MIINYHYLLDCCHYTLRFSSLEKKHNFSGKKPVFSSKPFFPEILNETNFSEKNRKKSSVLSESNGQCE